MTGPARGDRPARGPPPRTKAASLENESEKLKERREGKAQLRTQYTRRARWGKRKAMTTVVLSAAKLNEATRTPMKMSTA
jgi:hypothetical protein